MPVITMTCHHHQPCTLAHFFELSLVMKGCLLKSVALFLRIFVWQIDRGDSGLPEQDDGFALSRFARQCFFWCYPR